MNEHKASRTLVKSPPELWAECSDASSLTRHLDHFGDIRITKLEPEIAVAWEGERVSGTVRLEPSGWGTRVTLTAALADPAPVVVQEPEPQVADPQPVVVPAPRPVEDASPIEAAAPAPPVEAAPAPPAEAAPAPPAAVLATRPRAGLLARLIDFLGGQRPVGPPGPPAPPLSGPEPEASEPEALEPEVSEPEPVVVEPEPEPVATESEPTPERSDSPVLAALLDAEAALVAALDSLGQAHHRPFSRA